MQHIKLVFESLCRALIRFFDNRAVRNTDVEYYRMELDKAHLETQSLRNCLVEVLKPKQITSEVQENDDFIPISKSKFKTWETKRRELEMQSRNRAIDLANEARSSMLLAAERAKTTEQLEAELLENNG